MEDAVGHHTSTTATSWSDFGAFLQRVRRKRGISQERLAQAIGCGRIHIWRLEHGETRPSRILMQNLRMVCQLSPDETSLLDAFARLREYRLDDLEADR